jgi:hypothetical protein
MNNDIKFAFTVFSFFLILFLTSSANAQWTALSGGLGGDIMSLAEINSNLYAGGTAYLFRSTNNGNNWTGLMNNPAYAWSIAASGANIFCGVSTTTMNQTAGVYRSTNNGVSWSLIGLSGKYIFDVAGSDQQVIAASMNDSKLYRSTNAGLNWADITGDLNYGVYRLAISGNRTYAGGQGLHVTTNNGGHWSTIFLTDNTDAITVSDSIIFVGTNSHGVYRSTNYGQSWENTLTASKRIYSVYMYGSNVFAGGDTCFYVSTDGGSTFMDKMQGLGNATISGIVVHNNYVFVVNSNYLSTNIAGWKRTLQELIGIETISSEAPAAYILFQNYPNPFNPVTKIKFDIPYAGQRHAFDVRLTIYDLLGRQVTTLVNQQLQPGTYEVVWDASNYYSGVYFYKLITPSFSETKSMVLIK